MALTQQEAARLASLLPAGLSCGNARERLLVVAEILRTLTDVDHALSNADIRAIIRAAFGERATPAENTLAADIRAIAHAGALGLEVSVGPAGVRACRTSPSPSKVRLLLNAVQAARFLTYEQAADLQGDLLGLVSRHEEESLTGEVFVERRVRSAQVEVFDTLDVVARAMKRGKKIEFTYVYMDFEGRPQPLAGDAGETTRRETPIALYYSEGNYYVETYTTRPWRHGLRLIVCRADRMVATVMSAEPADAGPEVDQIRATTRERLQSSIDMISGERRRIFLRVRAEATNIFFDRFGYAHEFCCHIGRIGDPDCSALTMLEVPPTVTFFRWLASISPLIVLEEPPSDLSLSTEPLAHVVRGVPRASLVADYHAVKDAFMAYLDRARAPYVGT